IEIDAGIGGRNPVLLHDEPRRRISAATLLRYGAGSAREEKWESCDPGQRKDLLIHGDPLGDLSPTSGGEQQHADAAYTRPIEVPGTAPGDHARPQAGGTARGGRR